MCAHTEQFKSFFVNTIDDQQITAKMKFSLTRQYMVFVGRR